MRMHRELCLLALLLGCSEYKFDSTLDDAEDAEETLGEDEPTPLVPDEDTGSTELPPDDGIDEDPPPDEDDDPCTDVVTAFDIEEVSDLQDVKVRIQVQGNQQQITCLS